MEKEVRLETLRMSQPDKVKVWKQEGAEGGQVSEAGAGSKGAKDRSGGQDTKGPREMESGCSLLSVQREATKSFLQKERSVI